MPDAALAPTWFLPLSERPTLVLGATGSFGGALALELASRGKSVRALVRDPVKARRRLPPAVEIVVGDALDATALERAARGAGVLAHGVNYPYHLWDPAMIRVSDNVIRAAREAGAQIVFPGNVYALGRAGRRAFTETAPFRPTTRKGALRAGLEQRLRGAAAGGTPVLVVRAGDYFGPSVRNGLVDRIFANALAGKPMQVFGRLDIAHQWAYVPDLARLTADLLARADSLAPFEVVHFAGRVVARARDFYACVAEEAGRPDLTVRVVAWWKLRLAGLIDRQARELLELRYLFDTAVILDDPRRRALLPDFVATPLGPAIAATLASYREL